MAAEDINPWLPFQASLSSLDETGKQLVQVLPGDKIVLLGLAACTGLAVVWSLFQSILDDKESLVQMVGRVLQAIFVGLLCLALLKNYPIVIDGFRNTTTWLTQKFSPGKDMFDLALSNSQAALNAVASGDIYSDKSGFSLIDAILHITDWITAAALGILIAGVVAIMGGMSIWLGLLAKIAFGVGAALGPVFIALAPLPITRGWSLSWLKYMVTVSLYTVTATIALVMLQGVFQSVPEQMARLVDPATHLVRLPTALALLVEALSGIIILWQVPKLTGQMVGAGGISIK